MAATKIRLEQIERGPVLKEIIRWYECTQRDAANRLDALRRRSRRAAQCAGIGPADIDRLIREVRADRGKA